MRVLHVSGDSGLGGTESILRNIAIRAASTPDIAHEFLLFPPGNLNDALVSAGALTHVLGDVRLRQPLRVLRARGHFGSIIQRQPYQVIVFHQYSWMPLILSDLAHGVRQVRWFHNAPGATWTDAVLSRLHKKFPDLSIYCSEYLRSQLHTHGASAVLRAPVSVRDAVDTVAERTTVRSELNTTADSKVLVHVGRMTPMKGQRLLLQALVQLQQRSDWTCWIVGGAQTSEQSSYFHQLQNLARNLGIWDRIRFTGNRPDVARLLAAADVYCQPNLQPEAFGITFIEALYAGLPVITTAMGGAAEIVDESCGLLLPEATEQAVGESIRRLLEDDSLLANLRCHTQARARQLCDATTQVKRLGELLTHLVQSH